MTRLATFNHEVSYFIKFLTKTLFGSKITDLFLSNTHFIKPCRDPVHCALYRLFSSEFSSIRRGSLNKENKNF